MDYDENDFQSQNFHHLIGDDKFSANFRSFALPKFDLDEHLRFDGLVEEEVLLGIQGEENNWIDFTPGNSAIEFSSSAVESCSIARHKNVWSEATSSESVDLLLKSVGDDQMVNNKTVMMEASADDESHGSDNRVDIYLDKNDDHKTYMMSSVPVDPKLTQDEIQGNLLGSNGGHLEILHDVHGLSQATDVGISRIGMYMDHSNGRFSSDGEIGDNVTSLYNAIQKLKADDDGLCDAVLNKEVIHEVLKRTEATSVSVSDSSVLNSLSLESNKDVELVIENEKLNTGVFSGERHQRCISNSTGFLSDEALDVNSFVMYSDDKENQNFVSKTDALAPLNRKSIYSEFPEKSDGLVVDIPYQNKYLNGNNDMCENFFVKEEWMSRVALVQEEKIENNNVFVSSKSVPKIAPLTEGYQSVGDKLSFDSVGDDGLDSKRVQLIMNSTTSSDDIEVKNDDIEEKNDKCIDAIDVKLDPVHQLLENKYTDVDNTQMLTESQTSIHIHNEAQGTKNEDCGRMSVNSPSFICEKSGLVVEGNHMDADRPELKLDESKATPDESSFPVALTDISSLPVAVVDSEHITSPSTCCKSSASSASISVDMTDGLISEVHGSVDKESSPSYTNPDRIISGTVSKIIEKVQDLPPTIQMTSEELPLNISANKLVEEELGSVLSSPAFQKSIFHLSASEETTTSDLALENKEPLIQILSESDIQEDTKDLKVSCTPSLLSTAILASVSCPSKIKDISSEKVFQYDSGTQLTFSVQSQDSELSKDTAGLNLPIEQKGSPSCLAMPVPDSFFSKGNELKLSEASLLSNSEKNVVKETSNGEASSSDCVDDTIVREHVSNIVMQPPSPVRSIDFTQPQNDSSSSGNTIGDGKTLQLKENASCHYPREGKDDILNSLGVVSHVTSEASVAVVADDLIGHMKYPSQVCTGITAESNSSEANSRNSSSSEPNYSSPIVMTFRGCQPNNSDHQELKTSNNFSSISSNKDVITGDVDGNSNGLRGTSVEDGGLIFGVSTSKGLTEKGNCRELSLPNLKMPKENSQGFPVEVKSFDCSTEGKPKKSSRPSNEKKISSKGKIKKEARALKQSSVMDARCSISTYKSVGNSCKDKPLVEMQGKTPIDCSTTKTSPSLDAQTSSIPDLNSSSSLALSHHHFTDLQQVQLRAQIFVYGALISGMPPDEAYMVSAFGGTDGGRKLWHGVWHGSIERFQNQKSPLGYDTPHTRPAIWIPEHVSTGNDVQSKVPTPKSSNVIISSSVPSSTVSFPSPLWSLSYGNDGHGHHTGISRGSYMNFSQTPSPLARQSFVSRQHVGANSSWLSQSPRPAPWFFSSQISALDGNPQYSTVPANETAHVAPIRDSCGPFAPTVEVAHRVLMHAPDAAATTTAAVLQMETTKGAATSVNNKNTPTTQKVRKRKKSMTAEELSLPTSQILAESISTPSAFKSPSLPSASMLLSSNSQLNVFHSPASISASHNISPSHRQTICGNNNQQISILHDESCSKLDQAKLQAEEAAAFAASTVKYSQSIWSQLAAQKNSGIVIQIEEKLASAAAAAAAAASVAKAAAAAANVAAAAALQAKLMADEAMNARTVFNPDSDIHDVGKRLTGIPPVSILKGMDMIHGSGAIISAASEAARKRVESASAATKRAENLDAVVKAAKLAAEAVTQAGTVIAMGDPLPFTLSELVDAGSEGFWRGHDGTSVKHSKPSDMHGEEYTGLDNVKLCGGSSKKMDDLHSNDKETQKATGACELLSLNECHQQFQRSSQGDFSSVGPETNHHVNLSSIQKGSVVEVMSNEDGLKGAWFSARVVDINDNKAYVCYSDISTTEGKLQEWIILDNGEKAPRIRIAHSITSVRFEGTRKRQRANLGSYIWEVGDHVDTWIHDRWWEGTITEKDPGDEMKLIVQFTARGDKHVVNSWSLLRPSLIWKDGQWMEWSHANGKSSKPHEGDTPQEKRQRLASLEQQITSDFDADGTNKLSKNIIIEESRKPDASRPLLLSAKERTFSIGNNSSKQVTSDTFKQKRTGLQKEGSRVVFGVPRPGKKRKFMEVSKHYVANNSDKISEGSNDSIKFAKYLMPQVSRQSRNTSKVDSKGKKAIQVKPRGTVKAVNSQSFQLGSVDDKEKSSLSASNEEAPHVNHKDVISSFKGNTNYSDKMSSFKFSSLPNQVEKKKSSTVRSEHYMQPTPASLSKKKSIPDSQTNLPVKQTSSMDRTLSVEDKVHGNPGKIHEVMEPRRSNRRIQPTSRLLEGLQSSLITKIGSVSHDRKPPRAGSSSRGNSHC